MQKLSVPRGTRDILPEEWQLRWQIVDAARTLLTRTGFRRIDTPTFEDTTLFHRAIGENTDIVGKETYTFTDRGDRSLTLRPEGTAPVVRAYIAEGMHRRPQPVKLWYHCPMFRYEAPQKGRYREHYQIGAEVFGATSPLADAELILMLAELYKQLGIKELTLHINSIGDDQCRPAYREALVTFLNTVMDELCDDCKVRAKLNPLRTLDCKNERCQQLLQPAPRLADYLCDPCADHFATVRSSLDAAGVGYTLNDRLVRGLDYYTRTTFEFKCALLGAQDTIGAGGRYDGLVEMLGGPATAGVGFGTGVDRILLAMTEGGAHVPHSEIAVFLGSSREVLEWNTQISALAVRLREAGHIVETDLLERSRNAQLKQASKLGAHVAVVPAENIVATDPNQLVVHTMRGRIEQPTSVPHAYGAIVEALGAAIPTHQVSPTTA